MISEVVISTVRRKSILIKDWLDAFLSIFFPRCCLVCGGVLAKGEECLCARCNMDLPRTNYHQMKDNPVEKLFWGKIPLERATSYFFYRRGGDTRRILHSLKYGGQKEIGEIMGRHLAVELLSSGFFEGIDMLVPVPLHKKKEKLRGYNQSEWIARGVSVITLIPVFTSGMVREKNTVHIFPTLKSVRRIPRHKLTNLLLSVGKMWTVFFGLLFLNIFRVSTYLSLMMCLLPERLS